MIMKETNLSTAECRELVERCRKEKKFLYDGMWCVEPHTWAAIFPLCSMSEDTFDSDSTVVEFWCPGNENVWCLALPDNKVLNFED